MLIFQSICTPWAFGWTQLLSIAALVLTSVISFMGLRTFEKWKREKVEERRIGIAFDLLALAYESKYVFGDIRNAGTFSTEYEDMPRREGESETDWDSRGVYYAITKRLSRNAEFFARAFKLQQICMAAFGEEAEVIFKLLFAARVEVLVAAEMLYADKKKLTSEHIKNLERDIWYRGDFEKEKDKVGKKVDEFREGAIKLCRPVIERGFGRR